jgi:hypothetical protein
MPVHDLSSMSGKRCQMKIVSGEQTGVDRAALDFANRANCF